jgi:hypothetical protein
MSNLPLTDETKQFIIDHWAAIQPKDISAGWNVTSVEFEPEILAAYVTCNSPVPPSPRTIIVMLDVIADYAAQVGYPPGPEQTVTVNYGLPVVDDEGEPEPKKPARSAKK